MAHQVIPAIIAENFKDLNAKIKKVAAFVDWIQLDVMDGQFVDAVTWYNPEELKDIDAEILSKINLEAHLMVYKPEKTIQGWLDSPVKRIFFHYEATHRKAEMVQQIKDGGKEAGMAIDIITPSSFIEGFVDSLDVLLIMTVKPGKSGQVFREDILSKIKDLHSRFPELKIAVDGGINLETGKMCLDAGASILCSGSYILNSENPQQAINSLKDIK